jgi:hypothetical protein
MAEWPATLYGCITKGSFTEIPPQNVLRTQMDAGPAKLRRRSTANVRTFNLNLFLTKAQTATFDTFYVTTIQSGAIKFDMYHPRTHVAGEYRFINQPTYSPMDEGYSVRVDLELLP